MMQILMISFMSGLSLSFPLLSSPLLMGLWVLFIALGLSGWMGVMGMSWFGLILFLVYIGGMLVMFVYFVAITPNQRHNIKVFMFMALYMLMSFAMLMKMNFCSRFNSLTNMGNELMMFFDNQGLVLILVFVMLFVGLLIVVKLTQRSCGPLRPFN
uniref:NADH dehydrogenase subunit 6 n=1 Tax=Eclysippe vanelli TaxID=479700 RepID=B3TJY7_ECLVA|nr:NADH dehydrogenase subunit 6 [Eclysippe vanelli]